MKLTKCMALRQRFYPLFDSGPIKIIQIRHPPATAACIGADGLVIVVPSNTCDVRMRIINSDGMKQKCAVMAFVALPNMPMNTVKLQKDTFN